METKIVKLIITKPKNEDNKPLTYAERLARRQAYIKNHDNLNSGELDDVQKKYIEARNEQAIIDKKKKEERDRKKKIKDNQEIAKKRREKEEREGGKDKEKDNDNDEK